jgi:hypothetical protein
MGRLSVSLCLSVAVCKIVYVVPMEENEGNKSVSMEEKFQGKEMRKCPQNT